MRKKVSSKTLIIEVAEKIINEQGLEACTSRNLSKEANVALGTIYNYFDSRNELLELVFKTSWNRTKQILITIQESDIPLIEKANKLLTTLDNDINNRKGLGSYLIEQTNQNIELIHKNHSFLHEIVEIFINLLKESDKNKDLSRELLEIDAMWIVFGQMAFSKRQCKVEDYHQRVISKFL